MDIVLRAIKVWADPFADDADPRHVLLELCEEIWRLRMELSKAQSALQTAINKQNEAPAAQAAHPNEGR